MRVVLFMGLCRQPPTVIPRNFVRSGLQHSLYGETFIFSYSGAGAWCAKKSEDCKCARYNQCMPVRVIVLAGKIEMAIGEGFIRCVQCLKYTADCQDYDGSIVAHIRSKAIFICTALPAAVVAAETAYNKGTHQHRPCRVSLPVQAL